jgi:protein-tyrosine phosphatase
MSKVITILLLLCFGFVASVQAKPTDFVRTFPSLPQLYKENKFKEIEVAFEERVNLFLKGHQFQAWTVNRPYKEVAEEFESIREWRNHAWYSDAKGEILVSRPDFMVAQDLLERGYYRRPHLLAFDYNHTDGSYNSSTVVLNGQRFLALEAPTPKTLDNFFKLIQNYQANQLVRLTPANEQGAAKSHPYWAGKIKVDPKTNEQFLKLPINGSRRTLPIRYYALNSWLDHKGIDPKTLLNLLEKVRKDYDPNTGLIACHCSGGVGRTGTFIAGFLLLQEIDHQVAAGKSLDALDISIEKVVMQLSLQRTHMIAEPSQYYTLYQLVDLYVKHLKDKKAS